MKKYRLPAVPALIWPLLVLVIGVSISLTLAKTLEQRAEDVWHKRADNEAAQQSMVLVGWVEESYGILSGLVALVENSGNIDESEFLNAVNGMETRAKVNFVPTKVMLENAAKGWVVKYSSASAEADPVHPMSGVRLPAVLLESLGYAQDTPNEWLMSPPVKNADGRRFIYVALVSASKPEYAIAGVVDIEKMQESLAKTHSRDGLALELALKTEGQSDFSRLSASTLSGPHTYRSQTQTYTARANLDLNWQFSDAFDGGIDRQVAWGVKFGGGALSLLLALYVANLLFQNRRIRQHVEAATRDLAASRQQLERDVQVKSMLADLALSIQQATTHTEVGNRVLTLLAEKIACRQGVLALVTADRDLAVIARYGSEDVDKPDRIGLEQGALGQCVRDGQPIHLVLPDDATWRIRSGLGSCAPAEVWIMPIRHADAVVGVIELAVMRPLDELAHSLLDQLLSLIALPLLEAKGSLK